MIGFFLGAGVAGFLTSIGFGSIWTRGAIAAIVTATTAVVVFRLAGPLKRPKM